MSVSKIIEVMPPSELARRLSMFPDPTTQITRHISPQAITGWIKKNRVPADRCLAIEKLLEGKVTRYEMRPDVFGTERDPEAA